MIEIKATLENDLTINAQVNESDKPAVCFLHFSGGTLHMWNGVLPLFEKNYKVIVPDLRGHGKSDKPADSYHIDDMANDVYLLLRKLGIHECHIIGSSLGAEVGLSLAASHPSMVLSLVCEGAIYNEFGEYGLFNGTEQEIQEKKEKLTEELMQRKVPFHGSKADYLAEARSQLVEHKLWNPYFSNYIDSTVAQTEDGRYTSHYLNRVRTAYIQTYWNLGFEDYYKEIQCPVLFLVSREEKENPKITHSLSYFQSLVKSSSEVAVTQGMHAYVWMQYPKETGERVKSFIRSVTKNYKINSI